MKVLVDGRVFSSGAYNRGMGRYVDHIMQLFADEGHEVYVLLFQDCHLTRDDPMLRGRAVRYADYACETLSPDRTQRYATAHSFTGFLSKLITIDEIDLYVDATPFIAPLRYDLMSCATIVICYDFIPLKYPKSYIVSDAIVDIYYNGLARIVKADHIIAISETVAKECGRYLGVETPRLSVISPRLDPLYDQRTDDWSPSRNAPYIFGMVGGHKSKNSEAALKIYRAIAEDGIVSVRVNSPTEDQYETLTRTDSFLGITATHSISESQKIELQAGAVAISHLSLEEGFGIPLLEAVFLHRKVIVLDIPMNREIIGRSLRIGEGTVLWLDPTDTSLDRQRLIDFLAAAADQHLFDEIQNFYRSHWSASGSIIANCITKSRSYRQNWIENIEFKIFSSIPGDFCGVADYSLCYARSTAKNVVFFFSTGDQKHISHTPNIRLATYHEYEAFQAQNKSVQGIFNFAFSEALYPGIKLLTHNAVQGDALLVHERAYVPGLLHFKRLEAKFDDLILGLLNTPSVEASEASKDLAFSRLMNKRPSAERGTVAVPSTWLQDLPVRFISHLPAPVLAKMALAKDADARLQNDLEALETTLEFVPLGIDVRCGAAVGRAAAALRRHRGIQPDDLVIGHFGLILDDIKKLKEIIDTMCDFISGVNGMALAGRRVFFLMSGRIVDRELFESAKAKFANAGVANRLIHSNPVQESDFDAEIAMCDAVICFRRQTRGQLSHIFVRALCLGRPVIVNEDSGYAYDDRLLVRDQLLSQDLQNALSLILNVEMQRELCSTSFSYYQEHHRGDHSLGKILKRTET